MDKHYAASVQVPLILPYMDDNKVSSLAGKKKKRSELDCHYLRQNYRMSFLLFQ